MQGPPRRRRTLSRISFSSWRRNISLQMEESRSLTPASVISLSRILNSFEKVSRVFKNPAEKVCLPLSTSTICNFNSNVISVLEGRRMTVPSITSLIQQIYLDPSVWDKLEKLYLQFLSKNPTLPSMAVILSIL